MCGGVNYCVVCYVCLSVCMCWWISEMCGAENGSLHIVLSVCKERSSGHGPGSHNISRCQHIFTVSVSNNCLYRWLTRGLAFIEIL